MPEVFRLAVLEAEAPQAATHAARGSFGDIFRDLLSGALHGLGPDSGGAQLQVDKYCILDGQNYPALDDFDGFLITGSTNNAYDDDAWVLKLVEFTKTVMNETDKPIVGICFGHQIIGRALGAKVAQNPAGWELSVQRVDLTTLGQHIFGVPSLNLHHFHHDMVFQVPEGVVNLGSSALCEHQVFFRPGRILSFQGHPELDGSITSDYLTSEKASTLLDQDAIGEALKLVNRPHSGPLVATKMVQFLLSSHRFFPVR